MQGLYVQISGGTKKVLFCNSHIILIAQSLYSEFKNIHIKKALTLCLVILHTHLPQFRFEEDREPLKLHKQMIPHLLAIDVGVKISQAQLCTFIRGFHATFLVKTTLFKGEVA